jgi:hypothetical protein
MSEEQAEYRVDVQLEELPWTAFRKSASLEPFSSGAYAAPEPREVYTLIKKMGWTHQDVANMVGVQFDEEKGRGSTTVRGWMRPQHSAAHRKITYAVWRLLLINAELAAS